MQSGAYTALVTPFTETGVDRDGLQQLAEFQIANGITGILAVGTTGESPTLSWEEHIDTIARVAALTKGRCQCIAGTGSNNTEESLNAVEHAAKTGANGVLMVDPYYNGPSSLEIRREYLAPAAERFPELTIIPYVIPGRTGAQIFPEDLAYLFQSHPNVNTVKEATGNLDNMRRTRACCGPAYHIFSGDDAMTFEMMTSPDIRAAGVISVVSNIVPKAVSDMVAHLAAGDVAAAEKIHAAIAPLFGLVTVTTQEETPLGTVTCRARNPSAIKSIMALLGLPAGFCRQPLGKMTAAGLTKSIEMVAGVYEAHPEVFAPLESHFGISVGERLQDRSAYERLAYSSYL
ncbi:MAG: 4-hydroxy-tetrahydrodipicolinate synthase [Desulfosarcinaceae bacterium]|nr:4-hydroxy-tetrahydrodipicolinate synthase [Desulfosarcinaceae bacterium]